MQAKHGGCLRNSVVPFVLALFLPMFCIPAHALLSEPMKRTSVVTVSVDLPEADGAKRVRLWIPYPMSDEHQEIRDVAVGGNSTAHGVYRESDFGNTMLYAEWKDTAGKKTLTYRFTVLRREVLTKEIPATELPFSPAEFRRELVLDSPGATEAVVASMARKITEGKKTSREKARAIYDWIVENMYRDPAVKGCGQGEVDKLLARPGGKCADIHSVFVTLARASGVPAREVFGIRLPKGKEGDMTGAQHCWAEWYAPGRGWVVVDPADVRKAILEKKMTLAEAGRLRDYYFGAVDENRIAFGTGRRIRLSPPQDSAPLNYFMYPYAEADGRPLNEDLYGFNIGYTIRYREP